MASANQYGYYGQQQQQQQWPAQNNDGPDQVWGQRGGGAQPAWRWPGAQNAQPAGNPERGGPHPNYYQGGPVRNNHDGGHRNYHHHHYGQGQAMAGPDMPTNPRPGSRRANSLARQLLRGATGLRTGRNRRSPMRYGGPPADDFAPHHYRPQQHGEGSRGGSRNNITLTDADVDERVYEYRDGPHVDRRHVEQDRDYRPHGGAQRGDHMQQQQQQQLTMRDRDRRAAFQHPPPPANAPLLPTPQLLPAYAGSHPPQPRHHHRHGQTQQHQQHQRTRPFNRPRGGAINHRRGRAHQLHQGIQQHLHQQQHQQQQQQPQHNRHQPRNGWEPDERPAMEFEDWHGYGAEHLHGLHQLMDGLSDDDDNSVDFDYDSGEDDDEMFGGLDDLQLLTMLLRHDCPPEHLAARLAAEAQRRQQLQRDTRPSAPPLGLPQHQPAMPAVPSILDPPDKLDDEPIKVKENWEPADDKTHRERLADELMKGTCECVICFDNIEPTQGIWNCFKCFHIFHVCCVRKWALSQLNPINVLLQDRTWRCPSCRDSKRIVPYNSYCFCGKTRTPNMRVCRMPHSCGDDCGRRRRLKQPSCGHPCPVTCHPGPCPPCKITVTRYCACAKTTLVTKCGDADEPACKQTCDKLLACGEHRCKDLCHRATCPPCDRLILQECYCGRGSRVLQCSESVGGAPANTYRCAAVCNRLLPCKCGCRCPRVCHEDRCAASCARTNHQHPRRTSVEAIEMATDSLLYHEPGQCTIL